MQNTHTCPSVYYSLLITVMDNIFLLYNDVRGLQVLVRIAMKRKIFDSFSYTVRCFRYPSIPTHGVQNFKQALIKVSVGRAWCKESIIAFHDRQNKIATHEALKLILCPNK